MIEKGKHGPGDTFEELTFQGQAKSINGNIINLEKSIKAHIRKAKINKKDILKTKEKCLKQIERMINRLK